MELKFLKKKKTWTKGGIHTDPNVCWHVLLYIAFTVVILSFVFGFYLFTKINREYSISSGAMSKDNKTISKERIDNVLQYFSNREDKINEIVNHPSSVVDPSL